ncbi:pyridoxal phosphate phosphatase PHOSPHO2 isoform X2 [Oenanthe melanoleuca]|uniref:pyridoxal phosphate phosphatase PHOSPHO2 isoform X2 n=1 Tax=Oenanthe melanoleuca TaxID=2939378 RepID=UPI0024C1BBFC|nr:pyridoxal phosphate phosphatase PHOSPHO2 isoform X2 [Oenanthe melanoleuca]
MLQLCVLAGGVRPIQVHPRPASPPLWRRNVCRRRRRDPQRRPGFPGNRGSFSRSKAVAAGAFRRRGEQWHRVGGGRCAASAGAAPPPRSPAPGGPPHTERRKGATPGSPDPPPQPVPEHLVSLRRARTR